MYVKELERHRELLKKQNKSADPSTLSFAMSASEFMEGMAAKRVDKKTLKQELMTHMVNVTDLSKLNPDDIFKIYPKMVLTSIPASSNKFYVMLNDAVSTISDSNLGVVHTAICLNNAMIEWNNSHLVVIREAKGTYTFLAASIKYHGKSYVEIPVKEFDAFLDKVCFDTVACNK